MSVSEREYMRGSPGAEGVEDYERDALESEYGEIASKRKPRMRILLVALMVIAAIVLIVVFSCTG